MLRHNAERRHCHAWRTVRFCLIVVPNRRDVRSNKASSAEVFSQCSRIRRAATAQSAASARSSGVLAAEAKEAGCRSDKGGAKQAGAPTCSRHVLASTVVSNGARHCARRSRYFRVRQLVAVLVVIDHLLRNLTFGHPPGRMRVSTVTNVSKRRGYHRDNPVSNRRLPSRSPRSRRSRRAAPPARRRTRRRCSASASRR